MQWKKPDFKEITLSGEVTAYVNTDVDVRPTERVAPDAAEITSENSSS